MTRMQLATLAVTVLLPIYAWLACSLAMLERIERHLRKLHVEALGSMSDRSPESMAIRRSELGTEDGYPQKHVGLAFLVLAFILFGVFMQTGEWPWQ